MKEKDPKEQKNDQPGNADSAKTRVSPEIPASSKKENEKPEKAKEREVKIVKRHSNSAPFSFILTAVYLLILIALSVFLSLFALDVANEAFALKKSGEDVNVTLSGDYLTIETIADQLKAQHVIKHPTIFKLYAKLRHKDRADYLPGTATVTPAMGYDAILSLFLPPPEEVKQISVTIPEGYTVDNIIDLFLENGIGTRAAFEYVINEYPISTEDYWFLEGVDCSNGRIYRLEGYLYPDTYFFYDKYKDNEDDIPGTAAAKAVVFKMLNEFKRNFKKSYRTKYEAYIEQYFPNAPKMTLDQLLTLASILEKESLPAERALVSAVFYNRLSNPRYESINGRLESNATVLYAIRHYNRTYKAEDFGEYEMDYVSPYNSYTNGGLPPGPISSPTVDSVNAALYPMANCPYYYFVATDSHYSFFAETYAEHLKNVEKARNGEVADPYGGNEEWDEEEYNE